MHLYLERWPSLLLLVHEWDRILICLGIVLLIFLSISISIYRNALWYDRLRNWDTTIKVIKRLPRFPKYSLWWLFTFVDVRFEVLTDAENCHLLLVWKFRKQLELTYLNFLRIILRRWNIQLYFIGPEWLPQIILQ